MARQMEKSDPEYEFKKAFKIFDKRGDGFIDHAELKHVMNNIGEEMTDHDSEFSRSFFKYNLSSNCPVIILTGAPLLAFDMLLRLHLVSDM